jgi:hypothetical protein
MNYSSLLAYIKKNYIFFISLLPVFMWFLFFGTKLIYEPYVWDDLHFFRKYTQIELLSVWIGNWDPDNIETPSYRPFAVLYYHFTYMLFGENTFLFRIFLTILIFLLIYFLNNFFLYLNFKKKEILIFTLLITFSKIFTTLVSWFTISALIFCYILTLSSVFLFLKSLEKNNNFYYVLSLFFGFAAILVREELYILPGLIFLIYFLKFSFNKRKSLIHSLKLFPFFLLVITHMILRKKFVPEAAHFEFINSTLKFGENPLGFGGIIKVIKSSFLPMGYLSSQYSGKLQIVYSSFWILLILLTLTIILLNTKKIKEDFLRIFIILTLVLVCSLPHIAIARSFGIFLPSVFALLFISILINRLMSISVNYVRYKSYSLKVLSIFIIVIGIFGGIHRSSKHIESMSQFSNYIVFYDNQFIYGYKEKGFNLSIPHKRYLEKKEHLTKLNITKYEEDSKKLPSYSDYIVISDYDPLSF